jgi:hypothetical protein
MNKQWKADVAKSQAQLFDALNRRGRVRLIGIDPGVEVDVIEVEMVAVERQDGLRYLCQPSAWASITQKPPCNGFWELKIKYADGSVREDMAFYKLVHGWPDWIQALFMSGKATITWRGLKAPAEGGYPYELHPTARRRIALAD